MANELGYGIARVNVAIDDLSFTPASGNKGIVAVMGPTERGVVGVNGIKLIRSWAQFRREFGGEMASSYFPTYCKRALQAGATLLVCRIGHYSDITDVGTLAGTKATATLTVSADSAVFTAKSEGTWGNSVTVAVTAAASGTANKVDITVTLTGYPEMTQTVRDVSENPGATEKATLNATLTLVEVGTVTNLIPVGSVTLATGAAPETGLVDGDYTGNQAAQTGIYVFDGYSNFSWISFPSSTSSVVEVVLKNYVEARKDCRAILTTPTGITGSEAKAFRNKTGAYAGGTKLDSMWVSLFYGDIKELSGLTGAEQSISAIGDVIGALSRNAQVNNVWNAVANKERGAINNTLGVVYNLLTPGRVDEANEVAASHINPVVDHSNLGTVIWGNRTLQTANTLLKFGHVADLCVEMIRQIKPVAEKYQFEPNAPDTWRKLYKEVDGYLSTLKDGGAFEDYVYEGDQNADVVAQVTYNTVEDVQNGIYKFRVFIKPYPTAEYIGLSITVTNLDVDFSVITNQPAI
jgi:phage tail sheath protein FI